MTNYNVWVVVFISLFTMIFNLCRYLHILSKYWYISFLTVTNTLTTIYNTNPIKSWLTGYIRIKGLFSIGTGKTIYNQGIDDAVNKISESIQGLHCLIIYPNIQTFRKFYTYFIQRQINIKNEIILLNPFYESVGSVRQNLSLGHIGVYEFDQYQSNISSIISDSLHQHFGKVPMVEFKERLVNYSIHRGKSGVSVISDMGSYFFKRLQRTYRLWIIITYTI